MFIYTCINLTFILHIFLLFFSSCLFIYTINWQKQNKKTSSLFDEMLKEMRYVERREWRVKRPILGSFYLKFDLVDCLIRITWNYYLCAHIIKPVKVVHIHRGNNIVAGLLASEVDQVVSKEWHYHLQIWNSWESPRACYFWQAPVPRIKIHNCLAKKLKKKGVWLYRSIQNSNLEK